jgi:hypothetical protein
MSYWFRRKTESVALQEVNVSWPLLGISSKWVADRAQQTAAWEMYTELVTRVTLQPLAEDQGSLREALTSVHSLFGETRRILKQYGPRVAHKLQDDAITFAHLAVAVLNVELRPFLTTWHPALQEYESKRGDGVSAYEHEQRWDRKKELRKDLAEVRDVLRIYADHLARAAGIDPLHVKGEVK